MDCSEGESDANEASRSGTMDARWNPTPGSMDGVGTAMMGASMKMGVPEGIERKAKIPRPLDGDGWTSYSGEFGEVMSGMG